MQKLSKQQLTNIYKDLDLIILDADGTVAPNITVGLANEIFNQLILETLTNRNINERDKKILTPRQNLKQLLKEIYGSKFAPKRGRAKYFLLAKLFINGIRLYNKRITSVLIAHLRHKKASHEKLLKLVVETLADKKIQSLIKRATGDESVADYLYTQNQVINSLFPGIVDYIKYIRKHNKKVKVVMISESFAINGKLKNKDLGLVEHYTEIFNLNDLISNEFFCDRDGRITNVKINVQTAKDKEMHARNFINKYKAKNVAVIANDWEDFLLCRLPENKLVILRDPPKRMKKYANIVVRDGYKTVL
jgi:hypothetical protein